MRHNCKAPPKMRIHSAARAYCLRRGGLQATYDSGPRAAARMGPPYMPPYSFLQAMLPQCATCCLAPGGIPQCCPSRAWRRRFVSNAASPDFSLLSDRLLLRLLSRFFPISPPPLFSPLLPLPRLAAVAAAVHLGWPTPAASAPAPARAATT